MEEGGKNLWKNHCQKMTTAELEAKAAELEADLAGCKNNAERAAKIADALELEE